ncbi:MAG: tetratricopeptide repeat protein, partial [Euryarchaeota archaeon]
TILQSALEMDAEGDTMSDSQYEASIMALRQAAKIDPKNNVILLNLAHSLLVSGRAEKALGIVNVVQSRLTGDVEVENLKASCFIQLGRNEEARTILQPFANDTVVAGNLALI